ncbi:MAG: ABC transporter permease [Gemmatimonadota bacterium]
MNIHRILAMARKEALQLRRDTRSLILAFVLPVFMVIFFGYAITWDVTDIHLGVWDQDGSRDSRELMEVFQASGYFSVVDRPGSYGEVEEGLARGRVQAVMVIPPGYSRDLKSGRKTPVQLLLDGSDANTATIALNYAEAIASRHTTRVILEGRPMPAVAEAETRIWYNETLESRNMIVPGLVAVVMSIIAAMLTSLTIAREWERGTMEQLASTPVKEVEVVLGKLLPYLAIGFFDVILVVGAGIVFFQVPFNGNPLLLGILSVLFLLGALGVGIFISSVAGSQVFAMQAALVATYLPAILLSGFMYDIAGMPLILQGVTFLVPARYFIVVTRGILLKGVGIGALWPQAVAMLVFAVVGLALATRAFKKEIKA